MTLSTAQLDADFTNVNEGEAPDAATQLLLAAYAQETIGGSISDAAALSMALHIPPPADGSVGSNTPESTTDVALGIYQFFTGMAPTLDGLDYLVNNDGGAALNPNDLDSAYYAGFNQANRYYNFAINLITGNAAVAASFAAAYGSVSIDQVIVASYESIVGTPNVGAAAAAAAIAAIEAQIPYFQMVAAERAPGANQDLATKAIAISYIIEEAIKADVGYYAFAIDQFNTLLAANPEAVIPGMTLSGVDLLTSFPILEPGQTFTLTPGIDTITPPNSDNNIVVATQATLNSFDSINLGATTGNTLNWVDTVDSGHVVNAVPPAVTVSGVQTSHFVSVGAAVVNTTGWAGLTSQNVATVSGAYGADIITADPATNVTVFDSLVSNEVGSTGLVVNGGGVVTINEANGAFFSEEGITVNGGPGTTAVTVNQTETGFNDAQFVGINDSFTTIADVTLTGLNGTEADINGGPGGVALTSLTVDPSYDSEIFIEDAGGAPSALTLNVANAVIFVEDDFGAYKTLNLVSNGPADQVDLSFKGVTTENVSGAGAVQQSDDNMASLESIVISGAVSFTDYDLDNLGHLVAVTSVGSGAITVVINDTHTTFQGGSSTGTDFVIVHADATVPIIAGSATNNEIVFDIPGGALTQMGSYSHVMGFQILGTYTDSSGHYNLEGFSNPAQIADVDVRGAPSAPLFFDNSASTQILSVDTDLGNVVGGGGGAVITLTLADGGAGSNALTLVLGTAATDGIDTSDLAGSTVTKGVGTDTTIQALAPGAVAETPTGPTGGTALTAWTDSLVVNGAVKLADTIEIKDSGFDLKFTTGTNSPSLVAQEIVTEVNSESGALGFTAKIDKGNPDQVDLTATATGTAGNPTGYSAADNTTAGGLTENAPVLGTNFTASTGSLTVTHTDPGATLLVVSDKEGVIGAVDLTANESVNQIATAIGGLLTADGFSSVVVTANNITYTYPNDGDHTPGAVTVASTEYQIDSLSLAGVTVKAGYTFTETYTGGNGKSETVSYTATGADTATTVATHLANEINSHTKATGVVATHSGTTITLNEVGPPTSNTDQTLSFKDSQITVTTPTTSPVGNQSISAEGYQTVTVASNGEAGGGTNLTLLSDAALTSLFVTGPENLTMATNEGTGLAIIDTQGASGAIDLFPVLGSESSGGITATLGNASVELQGNASAGHTDTILPGALGGNGNDLIVGTTHGGNTSVTLGDGVDTVVITTGTGNSVSLGNGTGDLVFDTSSGTDTIKVGAGGFDHIIATGSGNFTIDVATASVFFGSTNNNQVLLGNGTDSVTFGTGLNDGVFVGTGVDTITFGAHSSTSGVAGEFDYVGLENLVASSFSPPTTSSQTAVITSHLDVITGLVAGDVIELPKADTIVAASNLAGHAGEALFAPGTYSPTGTFTFSSTGADALLTYDSGSSHFVSVVLVGGASEIAGAHAFGPSEPTWIILG